MRAADVIRAANAAFNGGDSEAYAAVADDVEWTDHQGGVGVASGHDRESLLAHLAGWDEAFTELQAQLDDFVEDGDFVLCAVTWKGTARAGGVPVDVRAVDVFEVRGATIRWMEVGLPDLDAGREAIARKTAHPPATSG